VIEAGFLVLLAVVVGLADLDPWLIILVMLVGWLLVSLIEYFSWRQAQGVALRRFEAAPAGPAVQDEEVAEDLAPPAPPAPPPEPPPAPPPEPPPASEPAAEEETGVQPAASEEKETVAEADERVSAARRSFADVQEEDRKRHRLDPLQPRPRRRWIFFGPYDRRGSAAEDEREDEQ
jgi:type IV secretory pathway VirB10-like protein